MDKNATSSFSTNHSELYRLRKDVEGLRICLTDNKQLKKDMEQIRHLLEKLNKKTERVRNIF
jgi:DNA polymerase I-like protein with 3'-5' exonuclease and polymerase domains